MTMEEGDRPADETAEELEDEAILPLLLERLESGRDRTLTVDELLEELGMTDYARELEQRDEVRGADGVGSGPS